MTTEMGYQKRYGYWNDWTGATHRIEIKAETTDGRYVIYWENFGIFLVAKEDVKIEDELKWE